jgi:hypothetical protein|tara:strand:- start:545 stop:751 length:207 start_codon:yes stop_codon:yes gene_type:complete
MKTKLKRVYEVFNLSTGEWDKKVMTDEEYEHFVEKQHATSEEMEAEYEIISNIVAQRLGYSPEKESMD